MEADLGICTRDGDGLMALETEEETQSSVL